MKKEKTKPAFRNWAKIAEITSQGEFGEHAEQLKLLLSQVQPESVLGKLLQTTFPAYYTDTENVELPIPWNRLLQEEAEVVKASGGNRFKHELDTNGILKNHSIPSTRYSVTERNHEEWHFPLLPKGIKTQCRFGATILMNGLLFVVTECVYDSQLIEVVLSPAECFEMPKTS